VSCRPRTGAAQLAQDGVHGPIQVVRDLVHEPDPQRGGRVEALAGDEVASRCADADLRECEGRDHGWDDPELDLGEGELRAPVGDRDVGARDQAHAAAERMSLDAHHHGRGTDVDCLQHPP
jgi:hypothetical protein